MRAKSKEKNLRIGAGIVAFIIVLFSIDSFASFKKEEREKFDLAVQRESKAFKDYAKDLPASVDKENMECASNIADISRSAVLDHIEKIARDTSLKHNKEIRMLAKEMRKPRPNLQIFISTSMPTSLVKSYAKEAAKYGGVLVLRGLPDGSAKKLIKFMGEISDKDSAPAQIDDEAFSYFGIDSVPSIVLSKADSIFFGGSSKESEDRKSKSKKRDAKYDKVTGAITIKSALELFEREGNMSKEASRRLSW